MRIADIVRKSIILIVRLTLFNNKRYIVKSPSKVPDPPHGGQGNFMSMDDFLDGEWRMESSSKSGSLPEEDNQTVIVDL